MRNVHGHGAHARGRLACLLPVVVVASFATACGSGGGTPNPTRSSGASHPIALPPAPTPTGGLPGVRPTTEPTPAATPPPARPTPKPKPTPTLNPAPTHKPPAQAAATPPPIAVVPGPTVSAAVVVISPIPAATTPPQTVTSPPAATATASSDDDSTRWGWIAGAAVLLAAVVGAIIALLARSRNRKLRTWQQQTRSAVEAAHLAQGLLPASGQDIVVIEHWDSVREQVEHAADSLVVAGGNAPNDRTARATRTAAQALRDVVFALDSARLMRDASTEPSDAQFADAELTTRSRKADLDVALKQLDAVVLVPSTPGPGPGPAQTRHA